VRNLWEVRRAGVILLHPKLFNFRRVRKAISYILRAVLKKINLIKSDTLTIIL
jgi:hypothetical protein